MSDDSRLRSVSNSSDHIPPGKLNLNHARVTHQDQLPVSLSYCSTGRDGNGILGMTLFTLNQCWDFSPIFRKRSEFLNFPQNWSEVGILFNEMLDKLTFHLELTSIFALKLILLRVVLKLPCHRFKLILLATNFVNFS